MSQEKEFKWDASPRGAFVHFVRALRQAADKVSAAQDLMVTDRYLDNGRADFSSRKIALRIRHCGGVYEATLKTRTALRNGLACRKELTKRLPRARSFIGALRLLQVEQKWEGLSLRDVSVRFTLRNRRRIYVVCFGRAVCEAALDRYVVFAAGRRQARREIELELKKGTEKDFARLLSLLKKSCGLDPVKISKVAGAEKLLHS